MSKNLYKAKRTDNGEWVVGFPFMSIDSNELNRMTVYEKLDFSTVINTYEIDPETVCQYIGKNDKNSVKIFEWDKLIDQETGKKFTIKWDNELLRFVPEFDNGWTLPSLIMIYNSVVIGNIHDKEV